MRRYSATGLALPGLLLFYAACAGAQGHGHSPSLTGPPGLNTVPNARMDAAGTVTAGVSTLDPYVHGWLGFQLAKPLYVALRQSAEVSGINGKADRLYPGVDVRLRLLEEERIRPAVVLGLQSATGHQRMAGEYIALSKRYRAFDFTLGLGWGRFGGAGHFNNPLKSLGGHFGGTRAPDGEKPNGPENWFTGGKTGIFGGIEYFTPYEGLSLKLDWNADRYGAERAAFGYRAPAPWSLGFSYTPVPWISAGAALQGPDKIMGRLSLRGLPSAWPLENFRMEDRVPMRQHRTGLSLPAQMKRSAEREGLPLYGLERDTYSIWANLAIDPAMPLPLQLGRAAGHMANHAGPSAEEFEITPALYGLRGPRVKLLRRDFERALNDGQRSPQEIWRNARFEDGNNPDTQGAESGPDAAGADRPHHFHFILEQQTSLSEEDSGLLHRSALIAEGRGPGGHGFLTGGYGLRLNIHDNLHRLADIRPRAALPVRSDVDRFAAQRFSLDRLYTSFTHSFRPDLHLALTSGMLEEMYGGAGGEILYRPFGSRLALGAEGWLALKRSPDTILNLGFNGDRLLSGHLQAWYDVPGHDLTVQARLGRYLAEDIGGTLALRKSFRNGARLEGFVTVTDNADFDLFGGTTHAHHGLRLTLPLGSVRYIPNGSAAVLRAEPLGRDTGQALDNPFPLYEITEPLSAGHAIRHWNRILE